MGFLKRLSSEDFWSAGLCALLMVTSFAGAVGIVGLVCWGAWALVSWLGVPVWWGALVWAPVLVVLAAVGFMELGIAARELLDALSRPEENP